MSASDLEVNTESSSSAVVALSTVGADSYEPAFNEHVKSLRGTMFYGSCLCGTVNNRGKVIYCYGDLVPRHGELFAEGGEQNSKTTGKDLLAAQLGVWIFGIIALLIVLLLIRNSIGSLKKHLVRVTEHLPRYHDDDLISQGSTTASPQPGSQTQPSAPSSSSKSQGASKSGSESAKKESSNGKEGGGGKEAAKQPAASGDQHSGQHEMFSDDGTLTPEPEFTDESSPIHIGGGSRGGAVKGVPVENLKKMRLQRKDFKKGGEALRGKNVTENFRVKEKEVKRTMK